MQKTIFLIVIATICLVAVGCDAGSGGNVFTNSIDMKFVLISAGKFKMGNKYNTYDAARKIGGHPKWYNHETPKHTVTISKPFYMQTTEVTQGQWEGVMGNNPSGFRSCGEECPVENVSFNDIQEFIKKLNAMEGGNKYHLPTEAQWEYACRAGSKTVYYFGDEPDQLNDYAWYKPNSGRQTHPVGQKRPNRWGLFDMYGNVEERCRDGERYYNESPQIDPLGNNSRTSRGGDWDSIARFLRSARRGHGSNPTNKNHYTGFRLIRDVD